MRVFFDTEFTGLVRGAKLVSIGLVDESGLHEFYAELRDTYQPDECSDFCKREVLPHLQGGEMQMDLSELRRVLDAWLRARGPGVTLVCDSPRDVWQLATLLPTGLPENVTVAVLGPWANLRRRVLNLGRRVHHQNGFRVHHALDDARVNRLLLTCCQGFPLSWPHSRNTGR